MSGFITCVEGMQVYPELCVFGHHYLLVSLLLLTFLKRVFPWRCTCCRVAFTTDDLNLYPRSVLFLRVAGAPQGDTGHNCSEGLLSPFTVDLNAHKEV